MRRNTLDRSIVIKAAKRGSCVVFWDRTDYLLETEKILVTQIWKVNFGGNELVKLLEENNIMFKRLFLQIWISPEDCSY